MTDKWRSGLRLPGRMVRIPLLFMLCLSLMGQVNAAGEYVVINMLDSGTGSLRWAIDQANSHPGPDVIRFHPNMTDKTILLASNLPPLTDNGTTIDASPNWIGSWPTGEPGIGLTKREFDSTATVGLQIKGADNCLIKGLRISGLQTGILITDGATGNTIGAGTPGGRMLIRACEFAAIGIVNSNSNRVLGCYIGTSKAGNLPEPNGFSGISIWDSRLNQIGGAGPLEGNIIGASTYGVLISGKGSMSNTVVANRIGVGMLEGDIGNWWIGIRIEKGASYNQVGGSSPDTGNQISRNKVGGVSIINDDTSEYPIESNSITWNNITHNSEYGVVIEDNIHPVSNNNVKWNYVADNGMSGIIIHSDENTVQGNTIVRNGETGIISTGYKNRILTNLIGTDESNTVGLGNGHYGVLLYRYANSNRVEGNVIVQNTSSGVAILERYTTANTVLKNYIGVAKNGRPLGNGYDGVLVVISPGNTIEQNVIAHNGTSGSRAGVRIEAATATGNGIWSNSIHSNTGAGIALLYGGNNNQPAPTISQVDCPYITGTGAPANGKVQLFSDNVDEGRHFEGEVIANGSGQWSYCGSFRGPYLTTTGTDLQNNTSAFSAPVAVASPCSMLYLPIIMRQ